MLNYSREKVHGGQQQLFLPAKLHMKESTASVPGLQNLELKQLNCLL